MKKLILICALTIVGCSTAHHQNWFVTTGSNGSLVHHYTGYTDLGETAKGSGGKYLKDSLQAACEGKPYKINRLDEWPTHNVAGKFLYWAGEGQCTE